MTARIIAVTNQKGGTGKTTVTMQLAGTLAKKNYRVLIVDTDKQGTATRWASAASDDKPFPAAVCGLNAAGSKVHREIKKYIKNYDVIVVDCPPAADSPVPSSALLVADLAIIPLIPSPPDLWAGIGIRELVSNVKDLNETLEARLLPNMCQPNTEVARESLEILTEFDIPIAKARLCLRTAHRQSAAFGRTVHDLGSKASAATKEVNQLTKEVILLLKLSSRKRVANAQDQ